MSARIHPGSNLDALAAGPIARAWGLTKRLHDVAHRYSVILGETDHNLDGGRVRFIAERLRQQNEPWPTYSRVLLRALLGSASPDAATTLRINNLSHGQLLALVEDLEEVIAGDMGA